MRAGENGRHAGAAGSAGACLRAARGRLLGGACVLALASVPAIAQEVQVRQGADARIAQAAEGEPRAFDIPAGDLQSALLAFSQAVDLQLLYPAELTAGLQTRGVRGTHTPEQALRRLLAGTGLRYRFTDAGTVTLAQAGTQGEGDPLRLGPITVEGAGPEDPTGPVAGYKANRSQTGTRIDAPIDEQPLPLQVLPREVIEDSGADRVEDAVEFSAGAAQGNTLGGVQETFLLRGFEAAVADNGSVSGTGVFKPRRRRDTANVERIEVLRGPAAALYGQGPPGGVINVITKKPMDTFSLTSNTKASSLVRVRNELDLNVPLSETWDTGARLVVAVEGENSFRFRDAFGDAFPENRQLVAPSLAFSPDGRTDVLIRGQYLRSSNVFDRGVPLDDDGSFAADIDDFFGDPGVDNVLSEDFIVDVEITRELTDEWTLTAFGAANVNTFEGFSLEPEFVAPFDVPQPIAGLIGLAEPVVAGETLFRQLEFRDQDVERYNGRLDLNGTVETGPLTHDLLVSFDYQRTDSDNLVSQSGTFSDATTISEPATPTDLTPADLTVIADQENTIDSYGIILFDQASIADRVHVLGGGRLDILEQETREALDGSVTEVDETEFSPRVGAVAEPFADLPASLFFSWGQSFEANDVLAAGGGLIPPQTGRVFEGGLRYGFNQDKLALTLTVFDIELENVPLPVMGGTFFAPSTQESRGVELSLQGEVTPALSVVLNYAYTDAEVTEVGPGGSTATVGERPQGVPEHNVSALAKYRFHGGRFKGLELTGALRFNSERVNFPTTIVANPLAAAGVGGPTVRFDAIELESFVRLDLGFTYEVTDKISVSGGVRNLLNQEIGQPSTLNLARPEPPIVGFARLGVRF